MNFFGSVLFGSILFGGVWWLVGCGKLRQGINDHRIYVVADGIDGCAIITIFIGIPRIIVGPIIYVQ